MPASNTKDCFREFVGQRVKGVMFDAIPWNRADLRRGTKTLVFEDGRGLTIASNGSYWIDSAEDVKRASVELKRELEENNRGIRDVLALRGEQV